MMIILIMILSSLWSIIIVNDFEPVQVFKKKLNKLSSGYKIINILFYIISKLFSCNQCFSAWLFALMVLISTGTYNGFLLMPIVYFLTYFIYKAYDKISI